MSVIHEAWLDELEKALIQKERKRILDEALQQSICTQCSGCPAEGERCSCNAARRLYMDDLREICGEGE